MEEAGLRSKVSTALGLKFAFIITEMEILIGTSQ